MAARKTPPQRLVLALPCSAPARPAEPGRLLLPCLERRHVVDRVGSPREVLAAERHGGARYCVALGWD